MATDFRWEHLPVGEGAREQLWIAAQVLLEKIDAAAVHGHGRRVGERHPLSGEQLEDLVLAERIAAVGFEHHAHRRGLGREFDTQFDEEGHTFGVKGLSRPVEAAPVRRGGTQVDEHARGVDVALQQGTVQR